MEPIDTAFEKFKVILSDIDEYKNTIVTEQDTRMKVIDRIFIEVLGWPLSSVKTEPPSGDGFIDYQFLLGGKSKLIVEAKRDSLKFDLDGKNPTKPYKLNGPVFSNKTLNRGIAQAIRYSGQKNTELACVTNGNEFVIFRASRLGDGIDTLDGVSFIFSNLEKINEEFKYFYDLLSPDSVDKALFRAYFQEAEGRPIRASIFEGTLRPQVTRNLLPSEPLAADIDRIMTTFFRRLTGDDDPDLLANCFVVTKESQRSEEKLVRISEDIINKIRKIETEDALILNKILESVKYSQRNEFVVIIGTKGAGKSTFIDRFFRLIIKKELIQYCIISKINLAESEGNEEKITEWLDSKLLPILETAIFGNEPPDFDEIQGMFFDEYNRRRRGPLKYLYENNKDEFKIDFGRYIEEKRVKNTNEYITRLLSHIVKNRKKVPCIVFDNADHFTVEFQQRVFQYARSLYEREICLMIVPVTDKTSWQLTYDSAMKSFEFEALYLPTPPPKAVLNRRIEFIQERLKSEKKDRGEYFVGKGIRLSLDDIEEFARTLHEIFLNAPNTSEWIGNLANDDIRRCLDIARQIVSSPHIGATSLLKSYTTENANPIPPWKIMAAMVKLKYDIYPEGEHEFIYNLFSLLPQQECSPLMGLRILYFLREVKKSHPKNPFIGIEQLLDYFHSMHIDPKITLAWSLKLLENGLIFSYDPTITDIKKVEKIQITLSGYQHLVWSSSNRNYLLWMLDVTPIRNRENYEYMSVLNKVPRKESWQKLIANFADYLLIEDALHVVIPDHDAFRGQKNLGLYVKRISQGVTIQSYEYL